MIFNQICLFASECTVVIEVLHLMHIRSQHCSVFYWSDPPKDAGLSCMMGRRT